MSGSDSYDYSRRNDDYGDDDGSTNSPSRRRSDDNGRDRSPEGNRDPERERDGHGSSSAGDGNPSLHVTSMSFRVSFIVHDIVSEYIKFKSVEDAHFASRRL